MTCQWCGDEHGVDQLCAKAQRGMTRRSFCFLFGAGIAGAALAGFFSAEFPDYALIGTYDPISPITFTFDIASHPVKEIGTVLSVDALGSQQLCRVTSSHWDPANGRMRVEVVPVPSLKVART